MTLSKFILVACVVLSSVGCATRPGFTRADPSVEDKSVEIDKKVLEECEPLPVLVTAKDTDVLDYIKNLIKINTECSLKQKRLTTVINETLIVK